MKQKNVVFAVLMFFGLILFFDVADAQAYGIRRGRRMPPRRPRMQQMKKTQPAPSLGLYWGHNFDADMNLVGGQLNLPAGRFWEFAPGAEYSFTGNPDSKRWQFNGDLLFKPAPMGFLYFGGGLAVEYLLPEKADNQTNFGGNALVGLEFGRAPMKLFIQGRWTFLEETSFAAMGGLRLSLR